MDSGPRLRANVLVLGGGGFVGANLCKALVPVVAGVEAYGRSVPVPGSLPPDVVWTEAEASDAKALAAAVERNDVVVHLASGSSPSAADANPSADAQASLLGTLALLDLCVAHKTKLFVFASSGGTVYGKPTTLPISEHEPTNPTSIYGIHKLAVEGYLSYYEKTYGLRHLILRIANPYGPLQTGSKGQGVVAALIRRALAGEPLEIWGDGSVIRDFIFIDDVVSAFLAGLHYAGEHRILNVGAGAGLSIRKVVDDIEAALGRGPLAHVFKEGRPVDLPINVLDISLIKRELGWAPHVGWSDGLSRTVAWFQCYAP